MDEGDEGQWRGWARDVATSVDWLMARFEDDYGFTPGPHEIRLASPATLVAVSDLRRDPLAPDDLASFYEVVDQVSLPDVGNGFFIHRADDVVTYSREEGGVFLPLADNPRGLPFGSTGGGLQYVVDWGGCVHRSTTASVEGDFETVAPSLQQFLERLRDAVVTFTETGAVVDV